MSDPVDMVELVNGLPKRPRGKACVVLAHDFEERKNWARELARRTGAEHIDLLDLFAENKELSSGIGGFMVSDLFRFLEGRSRADVLIVSGMEFLKAAWIGQRNAMEQFVGYLETWERKPCLLFVLPYDKYVATRDFRRFRQFTFVVDQKETLAL